MTDTHDSPGESPRPKKGLSCLGCLGIFVLILVGIFGCSYLVYGTNGDSDYNANNPREAIAQCEARIEQQLKAPSTATFDSKATSSGGKWTVTGSVDAENSFGAMVRTTYQCTVTIDGDEATTSIDYFE